METPKVNLVDILDRDCNRCGDAVLVNLSVMGSAPTIVAFTSMDSLCDFIKSHPSVSVTLQSVPRYE